ncbi:MAG: hypothetical protein DRQ47_02480 [Gammaproteobacteria bacterium]|nr:MAG: hypothetical protein DRQ47_02480 [Gammaproteobacteria bacterium]
MSKIIDIAGKKDCGNATGINTGVLGCLSLFGTPLHLIALQKGFIIPGDTEFNKAYLETLVQAGTAIPLIDAAAFEDLSSEDTMSTNAGGQERLNLLGLPKYKLMFEEGHEFYREIAKFTSYKSYDFIIGDEAGNWMLATANNGEDFKGFTAGQVVAEMRKTKVQGGDPESKSITVQFLDRLQWDRNYAILHQDFLDFVPQEVPTINGIDLKIIGIPAEAATTIVVEAPLASDEVTPVIGLIKEDFQVTINGTAETPTDAVESPNGTYTLTITALVALDVITVNTWNTTVPNSVVNSNDVLYRARAIDTVVAIA